MRYQDFELEISRNGSESDYLAKVRSPQGEAQQPFFLPDAVTLENLILKMRGFSRSSRAANCPEVQAASRFGELLFSNAFGGEISNLLKSCLDHTTDENGLRIKLILQDAPELSALPWEFLYLPRRRDFLAHSPSTPIVRYLHQATAIKPLAVTLPLKLLVVTASPSDFGRLDAYKELDELENALAELEQKGELHITWLEHATVKSFAETLKKESFHLLHFIGHSSFDAKNSEGALVLEDERGRGDYYEAMRLKALLQNHRTLRLVVLNSCEGAMHDDKDSFSSLAGTLMLAGIPAVIAMQFEISDQAAISFTTIFYTCLAKGAAIDEAVGEARLHLFAVERNNVEWGTPVLYLRAKDGELFDVVAQDLTGFKNQEGLEEEKLEREKLRLEEQRLAQEKIAQEKAIQAQLEQERLEGAKLEQKKKQLEQERLELEKLEKQKKLEQEVVKKQTITPPELPKKPKKQLVGLLVIAAIATLAVIFYPKVQALMDNAKTIPTVEVATPKTVISTPPAVVATPVTPEKLPFEPEMVAIKGGCFQMGSPEIEDGGSDEKQHQVCIKDFQIGKYEVTQAQWQAVMGDNPSDFEGDSLPVENVSWNDVQSFIEKLNAQTGKTYRLPTEAQWEYAARAGTNTAYSWGDTASHDYANYGKDECCDGLVSGKDKWLNTSPVGKFPANAFGLHDMAGNVSEWICSAYVENYNGSESKCSSGSGTRRAVRGGSWYYDPNWLRSAARGHNTPGDRYSALGFRLSMM